MADIRFSNVMIDCKDARALCEFYHRLLGWRKSVMFGYPALSSDSGVVFMFAGEEDYVPPVWPEKQGRQQKQMHLDFVVPDLDEAVEYARSLGAVKANAQFGGEELVTMLDPAGHPFCLCDENNTP